MRHGCPDITPAGMGGERREQKLGWSKKLEWRQEWRAQHLQCHRLPRRTECRQFGGCCKGLWAGGVAQKD